MCVCVWVGVFVCVSCITQIRDSFIPSSLASGNVLEICRVPLRATAVKKEVLSLLTLLVQKTNTDTGGAAGAQFTCFTSSNVQILTQKRRKIRDLQNVPPVHTQLFAPIIHYNLLY